eukprot:88828-Rhodomonas_salina.1
MRSASAAACAASPDARVCAVRRAAGADQHAAARQGRVAGGAGERAEHEAVATDAAGACDPEAARQPLADRGGAPGGVDPVRGHRGVHDAVGEHAEHGAPRPAQPILHGVRRDLRPPRLLQGADDRRRVHGERGARRAHGGALPAHDEHGAGHDRRGAQDLPPEAEGHPPAGADRDPHREGAGGGDRAQDAALLLLRGHSQHREPHGEQRVPDVRARERGHDGAPQERL